MKTTIFKLIVLTLITSLLSCDGSKNKDQTSNMKENYKSVEKLWSEFLIENPENSNKSIPESFYFCDNEKDADECAELVVKGIKQATATSLW